MVKDVWSIIGLSLFGILLLGAVALFYKTSYDQDATILGLNESVKASVISNADYSSRVNPGELYLIKKDFEKDFENRIIENNNVEVSDNAVYDFEYLNYENGASKAVRVILRDNGKRYQATYLIDIASSSD